MATALLEKEQKIARKERTWPELRVLPEGLRVPLFQAKGQKVKMPGRISSQLVENPPATVWPRIMEGIEDFGLYRLYVYAPKEAFREYKVDPAVIAEKDGKFYLIAAWG